MGQLIYFVPGFSKPTMSADDAKAVGLGHCVDGQSPECREATGPDKWQGLMLAFGGGGKTIYKPDQQVWRVGDRDDASKPKWYVGYWKDNVPKAKDLLRKQPLEGYKVTLLDDGEWVIPIASARFGHLSLPTRMQLGDDGKWFGKPLTQYNELCEQAGKAFDLIYNSVSSKDSQNIQFEFDDLMQIVLPALTVNYRIGRYELDLLGLVGDREIWAILRAVCDWTGFEEVMEAQSKNASASET